MNLSPHFTLDELTASQTAARRAIDNSAPPYVVENLRRLAQLLEQVRTKLGVPLIISSGYRSPALNAAVGGAKNSQHLVGEAADFIAPGFGSPISICSRLVDATEVEFDQLIQEGTWVHISTSARPRRQVLTARFGPGGTTYTSGL